jgi:hypothetical protein
MGSGMEPAEDDYRERTVDAAMDRYEARTDMPTNSRTLTVHCATNR